jgi:hypothetical protein
MKPMQDKPDNNKVKPMDDYKPMQRIREIVGRHHIKDYCYGDGKDTKLVF